MATLRSAGQSSSAKRSSSPSGISSRSPSRTIRCSRGAAGVARRTRARRRLLQAFTAAGLVALGAHDAVSARTDEQQRLAAVPIPVCAVAVVAVDAEHGGHERPLVVLARHVDQQLAPLVAAHLAQLRTGVDELQPEPGSLVEQRPQLGAVEAAEIERLLATVVVLVGSPSLARTVSGVQLADQRHVIGAIVAAADMPRIQPGPHQRAVDPAAARAWSHQPRHQPRRAAAREAVRVQRELDRQRSAGRLRRRSVDQRAQWLLPRRRPGRGRDHARRVPGAYRPAGRATVDRGDHDRRDVLAVVPHRTGALAVVERQCAARINGEERGRLVPRALSDHRTRQRVGARVPLDRDHPVARIPATTPERGLPDGRLDLGQPDVAQLCDRT